MKEYIKKQIGNIKQFSFAEMTSNSSGKTSGSGTAGLYIVFIGGLTFFMGCIDKMFLNKDIDVITQSIILVGIGATLLGYRKSKWVRKKYSYGSRPNRPMGKNKN